MGHTIIDFCCGGHYTIIDFVEVNIIQLLTFVEVNIIQLLTFVEGDMKCYLRIKIWFVDIYRVMKPEGGAKIPWSALHFL